MKLIYRRIYAITTGAMVGMILGGLFVAITLDIKQWSATGLTLGFIVLGGLWAIVGGLCGWAIDVSMNDEG